ncbi:MAG: hypothetical protein GEU98_24930 [Pseudonocardiaceae bacterium]|nr:hypothetical protein [Pseudonocardiaceae bacterium]
MRKIRTLAGAGLAGIALLSMSGTAGAAETASPGAAAECYGFWDDSRGVGCFQPYGDKIGVEDTKKDGIGVQVYWETDYGRDGICRDKNSGGGMGYCNYNMKEGQEVRIWLQFTDNGSVIDEIGPSQWLTI